LAIGTFWVFDFGFWIDEVRNLIALPILDFGLSEPAQLIRLPFLNLEF
jgi:hypothetical protein